jgi:hypothetical protein
MPKYVARFMKSVLGQNGHEAEICQRSFEIEAPNKNFAADIAKIKFCEAENVKEWFLHADRVQVIDAEVRPDIQSSIERLIPEPNLSPG